MKIQIISLNNVNPQFISNEEYLIEKEYITEDNIINTICEINLKDQYELNCLKEFFTLDTIEKIGDLQTIKCLNKKK